MTSQPYVRTPSRDVNDVSGTSNAFSIDRSEHGEIENQSILKNGQAQSHCLHGLSARKEPVRQTAVKILFRFTMTALIAAAMYVTLVHYSNKPVMPKNSKYRFNAIITGLSIALGLAIAKSLGAMIGDLRWWILSRRYRPKHDVELLLQAESTTRLFKLAVKSRRVSIYICVLLWLLLVFGSQVAVASLGLLYSLETAKKTALLVPGDILVSDVSSFQTDNVVSSKSAALGGQQYVANSYGTISLASTSGATDNIPVAGTIWTPGDPLMFCGDGCLYVFLEKSAESAEKDGSVPLTVVTSRSMRVDTTCNTWKIKKGGDGNTTSITVDLGGNDKEVQMPYAGGVNQTTFMINTTKTCGVGCSEISAFEASSTAPWYYQCNVTVGEVTNATRPEHQASDDFRNIASGAIALQGYGSSSLANDTDFQYQTYPAESIYGVPVNGSTASLAILMSRFTIGTIAVAAQSNDDLIVKDTAPQRGFRLDVAHFRLIIAILVLLVSVQVVLDIFIQTWANRVVIPHGDNVNMAKVLGKMAAEKEDTGTDTSENPPRESLWIYRARPIGNGLYDLYLEGKSLPVENDQNGIQLN